MHKNCKTKLQPPPPLCRCYHRGPRQRRRRHRRRGHKKLMKRAAILHCRRCPQSTEIHNERSRHQRRRRRHCCWCTSLCLRRHFPYRRYKIETGPMWYYNYIYIYPSAESSSEFSCQFFLAVAVGGDPSALLSSFIFLAYENSTIHIKNCCRKIIG